MSIPEVEVFLGPKGAPPVLLLGAIGAPLELQKYS